jgi:hypothetical protein
VVAAFDAQEGLAFAFEEAAELLAGERLHRVSSTTFRPGISLRSGSSAAWTTILMVTRVSVSIAP